MYTFTKLEEFEGTISGHMFITAHYDYTFTEGFPETREEPEEPDEYEVTIHKIELFEDLGSNNKSINITERYMETDALEGEILLHLLSRSE